MAVVVPCYHPIPAYQGGPGEPLRLYPPVGTASMSVPCGSCIGCRMSRAVEWGRRCEDEAREWRYNSFLTLTYDDDHKVGELVPDDLQAFLKRLRVDAVRHPSCYLRDAAFGVRFFACGEYGESNGRAHYHALLFNCAFSDLSPVGRDVFRSSAIARLWPFGYHVVGTVTGASACYVAKYNCKGSVGCDSDGVVRRPPFLRMSLKPGIGSGYLDKYRGDLRFGYCVDDGKRKRIPRAYKRKVRQIDPELYEVIDERGYEHRRSRGGEGLDVERLEAGERIAERRYELYGQRVL
ncbi:MAG: replication initiator protein [Microviridae sp.]|nr:MAG: replication initiator protein [Microviridae sp.]